MSYLDGLRKRLDVTFAPAWRPSVGEELAGVVERLDSVPNQQWGPHPAVTVWRILNDHCAPNGIDDRVAWHAMHTASRMGLERATPEPGNVVIIRYNGKKHNDRTGQDFESYDYYLDANPPAHLVEEWQKAMSIAAADDAKKDEPF